MKFRDYCVVLMGKSLNREQAISEIRKISENEPKFIDSVGIVVVTFTSVMEVGELTELFRSFNWNFLVFDLDPKSSGVNITYPHIHEGLFGFLNESKDRLDDLSTRLIRDIAMSSDTKNHTTPKTSTKNKKKEVGLTEDDIKKMSPTERQKRLDEYIDFGTKNGFEKLTENDKKIMELLAK